MAFYRDGRIVAIALTGGVFLKTDALSRPAFEAVGSKPFTYAKSSGLMVALSYWALPDEAFDDPDALRRWVPARGGRSRSHSREWRGRPQAKEVVIFLRSTGLRTRTLGAIRLSPAAKPPDKASARSSAG